MDSTAPRSRRAGSSPINPRSPTVRTLQWLAGAQISSTTSVMISMSAASSSGSRCRFSVDSR
ncbi:Uncharacterised protein [Mycobacterium tuberculosis]|nr:Uncharacterised protein [Mycobacterium tuberculosis]